jgi:hypothetical protein
MLTARFIVIGDVDALCGRGTLMKNERQKLVVWSVESREPHNRAAAETTSSRAETEETATSHITTSSRRGGDHIGRG